MKFQPETLAGVNVIGRHDPGRLQVGSQWHDGPVLVPWQGEVKPWDLTAWAQLGPEHLAAVAELQPELVILGSGSRLVFPPPAALRPLIERRIGFETMDTAAACRTYNVLVTEGRRVVAALLLDKPPAA